MLKFAKCKTEKGKICRLLFISCINTGNLVLPPNTGRLDELDSSQFILHRNGSLKKKSSTFVLGSDWTVHKMNLQCHSEM